MSYCLGMAEFHETHLEQNLAELADLEVHSGIPEKQVGQALLPAIHTEQNSVKSEGLEVLRVFSLIGQLQIK